MDKIKLFITALATALTARLGLLAMPVYILFLLNVIDYATGITAAPYRGEERKSAVGVRGIAKKICILLLVGVAAIVDWVAMYAVQWLGFSLPFTFAIACGTSIWLICNEVISILENIGDIGVRLPPFLMKAVEWVKKSTEDKGEMK